MSVWRFTLIMGPQCPVCHPHCRLEVSCISRSLALEPLVYHHLHGPGVSGILHTFVWVMSVAFSLGKGWAVCHF